MRGLLVFILGLKMNKIETADKNKTHIIIEVDAPIEQVKSVLNGLSDKMGLPSAGKTEQEIVDFIAQQTKNYWFTFILDDLKNKKQIESTRAKIEKETFYETIITNHPLKGA